MNIRNATAEDAAQLAAAIDKVARERRFLAITSGFPPESTASFIRNLASSNGVLLVSSNDSEIIGWCDISPLPFEGMKHVGKLGMGVVKEYRQMGLGRKLLGAAIEQAFQNNLSRIELEVFSTNFGAIALYERLGFSLEGRKVGSRILDGASCDMLVYALLRK